MPNRKLIIAMVIGAAVFGAIRPFPSAATSARDAFYSAEACRRDLHNSSAKIKYRHNWMRCINKFQAVYRQNPAGPWAAAGLYMSGRLYQELARYSGKKSDEKEARDIYERVIKRFPHSRYRNRAALALRNYTPALQPQSARSQPATGARVTVKDLRYWSNPDYTRIVIDASNKTIYTSHLLKRDPSLNKPQRLYVDLKNSRLGKSIHKQIPINDDLLTSVRAGQYTVNSVRVVVDIKSFRTYKIFSLRDPFRVVIDILGSGSAKINARPAAAPAPAGKGVKMPPGALAKQLALGVNRIVVDPGHGGRDYGAPGYLKGEHEKYITLQIARRLAAKLHKELGCQVILTRRRDKYLTLEERTAFANTHSADLFISIHTNSSRDRRAYGIETYYLNLATDNESIRVAAFENATSAKNISDLQSILNDLMQNAKINESSRLAAYVQSSTVSYLKKRGYTRIKNKGVKRAPFYVLLGAQMPAILVETSFISNPRESRRLLSAQFQDRLCQGIVNGVKNYIRETHPTALLKTPSASRPQG